MVDIYICSIRCCGALLTRPDQRGAKSVLPVGGCTSAVTGVFHWVRVAAVGFGLQLAWVLQEQQMVVGTCCSCTASEVDGVVTGCPATSTLGWVSGLTASG